MENDPNKNEVGRFNKVGDAEKWDNTNPIKRAGQTLLAGANLVFGNSEKADQLDADRTASFMKEVGQDAQRIEAERQSKKVA